MASLATSVQIWKKREDLESRPRLRECLLGIECSETDFIPGYFMCFLEGTEMREEFVCVDNTRKPVTYLATFYKEETNAEEYACRSQHSHKQQGVDGKRRGVW